MFGVQLASLIALHPKKYENMNVIGKFFYLPECCSSAKGLTTTGAIVYKPRWSIDTREVTMTEADYAMLIATACCKQFPWQPSGVYKALPTRLVSRSHRINRADRFVTV